MPEVETARGLDVVTFEILRTTLANLVHEMGLHLERAAFSPSIVEGRDFTFALMDVEGSMVANGPEDQPAHLGTLEFSARAVIDRFDPDDVQEGDFFLFNDPYTGGTHCQDIRIVHPTFADGELLGWMLAVGHWTDVGGPFPGTFNPIATSCYAEGIRIPPVKFIEGGKRRDDIIDLVLANCRLPEESRGDLLAMIGSIQSGETRLLEILHKYGRSTVEAAFREVMDHSERLLLAQTSQLRDGVYSAEDVMDMDPPHPDQPPVYVRGTLEVREGRLIFDLTTSDPQPLGSIGGTLPTTWSGILCAVLNFFPGVPFNHGVFRVIELKTRPGTCVHIQPPTPFSGMAAGALEKVIVAALHMLSKTQAERRTAAMYNLCNMTLSGRDPRFDDREWIMYLWLPGGFGGSTLGDAGLPTMMLYGPGCRNQPVEVHERIYPILYERVAMRADSMGPGRFRGGPGVECVFRLTDGQAELSAIGDRNRFPVWGLDGGQDGGTQDIVLDYETPDARSLGMHAAGISITTDRRIHYFSAGGGGYGNAFERSPEAVLGDVLDGLLTTEAAARDYGVVIRSNADGPEIDPEATATARRDGSAGSS